MRIQFTSEEPVTIEGNVYVKDMVVEFDDVALAQAQIDAGLAQPIETYHCIVTHVPRD